MSLKITVTNCQDLPTEVKQAYNIDDHDAYSILTVVHNGSAVIAITDGVLHNTAGFTKKLKWIAPLLEQVYALGKEDADFHRDLCGNPADCVGCGWCVSD